MERVIATKEQLDALEDDARPVRARPPASFELLAQAHRLFDARALAMPRDYERILRAHDGIDHVWRTANGAVMSVFGHRELFAQRAAADAAVVSAVIIAASDDGEQVALVPGPMELPAAVVRNAQGRITGRFPSATAWLEWIHGENSAALDRARLRRKANLKVTQVVER
ncbi:MAG TPA: hypothetical protein VL463_10560 [Kofleriaceae bacterium]|nr:hypothetical protein [Kofleriaceae bacterium]